MAKRPSAKLAALLMSITAATVGLDQLVKYFARVHLDTDGVYTFIPNFLQFQLQMNDGASLGILSGSRALLVVASTVASLIIAAVMLFYKNISRGERISLAFILGGAVGNLIDRAATGFVTDMLFFPWIGKIPLLPDFVCNVADIAITFGVAALIVVVFVEETHKKPKSVENSENSEEKTDE